MKTSMEILDNHKWINAAGTAGFAPTTNLINKFPDLGLFTTNPISYFPRTPAKERCVISSDRNFLLHNGFPCPGFKSIVKKYQKVWETSVLPICVSLLFDHPKNLEKIVRSVENFDNITVIEILINHASSRVEIKEGIKSAVGELPIIISIPFEMIYSELLEELVLCDVMAISLQPPRGSLMQNKKIISGRLYGPSILPQTLSAISYLFPLGKPIIAGVGAYTSEDIQNIYEVGANNFQPNELIWREYF